MTRPLRIEFAGALYHITARGNAQGDIYTHDELDRCHIMQTDMLYVMKQWHMRI
jgi:hypothetical protein